MLVNMNEVLRPAKKGKYAVGLFNAVNLELARGIIAAADQDVHLLLWVQRKFYFPMVLWKKFLTI